jgi:site-specific DNA-methyltransferase (adenine-specific)
MTRANKLFYGDNLDVMRKYIKDESVDLCYIDPPFNSKRNYNQIYNNIGKEDTAQAQAFVDTWTWDDAAETGLNEIRTNENQRYSLRTVYLISGLEKVLSRGSLFAYLVSITLRVNEIHRALKSTGSFYLHCDPTASHYLKLVLDSIFCANGGECLNEIIWQRTGTHSDANKGLGSVHDVILVYSKSDKFFWAKTFKDHDPEYLRTHYTHKDSDGRVWRADNLTAKGLSGGGYEYAYKGAKNLWRVSLKRMEELDAEGRLYFAKTGGISYKRYLDEMKGTVVNDVWTDIPPINSQAKERLGYPTQKPEALLERILSASSNDGDTILDAYCGCGTTVAVAQRLKRKWIGIDITYQSISLIIKRLEDTYGKEVLGDVELSGVPVDRESAVALSLKSDDKTRKEFEKWAVLTYSNNRAMIREKKGSDKGIDGIAFAMTSSGEPQEIIFSVKSGKVHSSFIRDLRGTMERENAAGGILITLSHPTHAMRQEAKSAGFIENDLMASPLEKIKIVTVDEILAGERLHLPLSIEVLKSARRKTTRENQKSLFGDDD